VTLFVDTSAWYAAADRSDTSHDRAKEVLTVGETLVTTDHVLVETWVLLRHRLGRAAAERFWGGLRAGAAEVETVTAADLARRRAFEVLRGSGGMHRGVWGAGCPQVE
jgi:predicted nucleic acid-binding protein